MHDERLMGIIDTAIQREKEAVAFYTGLLDVIQDPGAQQTISFIADEERKHQAFLEAYRNGTHASQPMRMSDVIYYRIAEHQEEPELTEDIAREKVFLLAAHREKRSHAFYTELAALHTDEETRDLLRRIANEELKHKEKMEYLYANTAFPQTAGG
jgi:rubrerythrin